MRQRERLKKILGRFSKVKILVIGDVMLDGFIWGKVSRISPEAPVPVVLVDNIDNEDSHLGGAANVANNIHSLGGKVSLCGVVGNDENGQKIRRKLIEIGIDDKGVLTENGRQTIVKTRIFANQQQVVRIDRETTGHPGISTLINLSMFLRENIKNHDGVVISDYGKGLMTEKLIRIIFQKTMKAKKMVLVDSKMENFFLYKGAKVVTPNMKEAGDALGISITDEASLKKAGRLLLKRLRCGALVITRGEKGMTIFEPGKKPFSVHTVAKEVFDVTGAGDTVIGTLALALGTGVEVMEAAKLANFAAGVVVEKRGTATVNREELIKAIKERA